MGRGDQTLGVCSSHLEDRVSIFSLVHASSVFQLITCCVLSAKDEPVLLTWRCHQWVPELLDCPCLSVASLSISVEGQIEGREGEACECVYVSVSVCVNERERELKKEPERGGRRGCTGMQQRARNRSRGSVNGDTPRVDSLYVSLY